MGQDFDKLHIQERANIQNIERTQDTKCQETNYLKMRHRSKQIPQKRELK